MKGESPEQKSQVDTPAGVARPEPKRVGAVIEHAVEQHGAVLTVRHALLGAALELPLDRADVLHPVGALNAARLTDRVLERAATENSLSSLRSELSVVEERTAMQLDEMALLVRGDVQLTYNR